MSLLERVSTLLRANLNDLVEKAEDPERMLKQIVGYGEPTDASEDASGHCDCRSAFA